MKIFLFFALFIVTANSRSPLTVKYVGLTHVGGINTVNDEGTQYEKNFYISNFLTTKPIHARSVCKSFGQYMDVASFENREELQKIQSKLSLEMNQNSQPETTRLNGIIIGGLMHKINGRINHFWTTTGLKIDQISATQDENCVGLKKSGANLSIVGLQCEKEFTFICQDLEFIYAN